MQIQHLIPADLRLEDPLAGAAAKAHGAAQQFEAILLAEILRAAHDEDSGWLSEGDGAMSSAIGMAQEILAQSIAEHGGLGLAPMIEAALNNKKPL